MREPARIWEEIAAVRRALRTASGDEAAALRSQLKEALSRADALDAGVRPDQLRLELAMIEGELREEPVATTRPWWRFWRRAPAVDTARLGLIERRDALRERLGLLD